MVRENHNRVSSWRRKSNHLAGSKTHVAQPSRSRLQKHADISTKDGRFQQSCICIDDQLSGNRCTEKEQHQKAHHIALDGGDIHNIGLVSATSFVRIPI